MNPDRSFDRRFFLRSSGLGMAAFGLAPGFLQRALAESKPGGKKVLVTVFLRGGADGLSMIPPVADSNYYRLRPTLALAVPGSTADAALALDGTYGLHPALAPLKRLYDDGLLAVVHRVGSPHPTRSHFDAQEFLEAGTPGSKSAPDGWLNRALQKTRHPEKISAFRAVAVQGNLPRSLVGAAPAVALSSLASFRISGNKRLPAVEAKGFEALYASAVDEALRTSGAEAFDALGGLETSALAELPPQNGAVYPSSQLGKRMQDLARLIRGDLGLQLAATDSGGWDTHVAQGAASGALAKRLDELALSLLAFATDLGPRLADVCVVVMTEFGRTARENGNRGTDHGTGSVMLVLGGGVKGKRVFGAHRELTDANLFEGRDLKVDIDFREVLAAALRSQLGLRSVDAVFPGFTHTGKLRLFS